MQSTRKSYSLDSIPILLASTSPRRISLLELVKIPAQVCSPHSDESPKRGESPLSLVKRLAEDKANSVVHEASAQHEACFILAADTIVVEPKGGKVLGKPRDEKEARRMLKMLSGKTHTVLTGYCILLVNGKSKPQKKVRVIRTQVKIRSLTDRMIAQYVATGEPMDKAGSYGAQGLGTSLIESIQGSYTNVVGLPLTQVLQDLETSFKIPLFSWIK